MSPLQYKHLFSALKFLFLTIPVSLTFSFILGFSMAFSGSRIIPLYSPVSGSFSLGFAGGLVWLFFIGGFFGLIFGLLVSLKIWKRIRGNPK